MSFSRVMRMADEVERIKAAYAKRDVSGKKGLYTVFNPSALFTIQQREKETLDALKRNNLTDLSGKKILDIGCGNGGVLRDFIKYGASPESLYGVDLIEDRIEEAKRLSPNIGFRCSSAENIPFEDRSFDIVLLFTVFTSIFDLGMKKRLASEALRLLGPGGVVIYYDYRYNNPRNRDVRGVKRKEIEELFPGCSFDFTLTTLAPPLSRAIAPYSTLLCRLLEKIPFLKTHWLAVIMK